MSDLYNRKANLVVSAGSDGLDLSQFKFTFRVSAMDAETPNTCMVRIYNLKDETVNQIRGEFSRLTLQAGYVDSFYGIIFDGTIKQFRKGRESNVDSYLDIFAADGDIGYNFGVINKTLEAGASPVDQAKEIVKAMGVALDPNAEVTLLGGILPRGKVLFGMARAYMRNLAATNKARWSIQNGVVVVVPLTGYLPSEAVKLTSRTGMIGIPEATDDGILIRTLLNPQLAVGNLVQIDNKSINQVDIREQGFPQYNALSFPASVSEDGFYRVLVIEHSGDTRGQAWYSDITCLSVDPSASPQVSVKAFG